LQWVKKNREVGIRNGSNFSLFRKLVTRIAVKMNRILLLIYLCVLTFAYSQRRLHLVAPKLIVFNIWSIYNGDFG